MIFTIREEDLSEVLQMDEIYSNCVQGEICNKELLEETFGDKPKAEIVQFVRKFIFDNFRFLKMGNSKFRKRRENSLPRTSLKRSPISLPLR